MKPLSLQSGESWPRWKKFIFCFFFIYLALNITPWNWLGDVPVLSHISEYYRKITDWMVNKANAGFFHVRKVLVPLNGSGDTSFGWAQVWLNLSLAVFGALTWQLADRKRKNYAVLNYWLCLFTRYYIAYIAFVYGSIKIFTEQMGFPNLSELATPLGDFLPMRLSWMFIGYSAHYQIFSGVMETLAGLLLMYRRTATLGTMLATGVFLNVLVLNLSYDIPVKIFSMHIVLCCLYLLVNESGRLMRFFILNKEAAPAILYTYHFSKRWMRYARIFLKIAFLFICLFLPFRSAWTYHKFLKTPEPEARIKKGFYDVSRYAVNSDTIAADYKNTQRWQNVIFDQRGSGSIVTSDTLFKQRYGRGYFDYEIDSVKDSLILSVPGEAPILLTMHFELPDSNTIRLRGLQEKDTLFVELKRSNRHFQLAERQFHWLSERNR